MVQFRRSKKIGPFRLTAGKRGLSISAGAGPLRVSKGADGKYRRTLRAPGTGIYDTKVIGSSKKKTPKKKPARTAPPAPAAAPAGTPAMGMHGGASTDPYPAVPVPGLEQHTPPPAPGSPLPAGPRPIGAGETDQPLFIPDQWAALMQPDGTPRAYSTQRHFVESKVWNRTGKLQRLHGMSIRQAEHIMAALGEDPDVLRKHGRGSATANKVANIAIAVVAAVVALICLFMPGGPLLSVAIAATAGYCYVARRRMNDYVDAGGIVPIPVYKPGSDKARPPLPVGPVPQG